MKSQFVNMILAIIIVLSFVFIVWAIGFIIPRYWLTAILLIYCIYIFYRILNPKIRYYFVTYWYSNMGRGRMFISSNRLRVYEIEKDIAQYKEVDNVVIDYYAQITKEEYEYQTNQKINNSKKSWWANKVKLT